MADMVFDHVVVGAGTAGCIVAARLAEDPAVTVALIEAGPRDRHPLIHVPVGMIGLINHPKLSWGYLSEPQTAAGARQIPLPRGRMLGGSGGLNGMVYTRGHRRDYDDWAANGATGWSYEDVMPYFKRSQNSPDLADAFHGRDGPVRVAPVTRPNPLTRAFLRAAEAQGFAANDDINGAEQDGFGLRHVTIRDGRRETSATAFLRRTPPNLKIVTTAMVDRVEIRDNRARAVVLWQEGAEIRITARAGIVLAAGTFGSPTILLRSGVGPGTHLAEQGITVQRDLPGVGAHLADHPSAQVVWTEAGHQSYGISLRALPRLAITGAGYLFGRRGMLASNIFEAAGYVRTRPDLDRPDIQIVFCPALRKPGGTLGVGHGFAVGVVGLHPQSTGSVRLASPAADTPPRIDLGLLTDARDTETMLRGLKVARRIATDRNLADHGRAELSPGPEVADDDAIRDFLRASMATAFHPVGTCRMGHGPDAVVGPDLRVHGVDGLRIADASIMPRIVGGNTNAPVMMIAEKAADLILGRSGFGTDRRISGGRRISDVLPNASGQKDAEMEDRIAALEARLAEAENRLGRVEDIEAIKRLQRAYGYYLDKGLWQAVTDLFAPEGTIEIAARGVYRKDRIYPFLRDLIGQKQDGLAHGQLMNHMQLQGIVTLSEDGQCALGRWRAFIQVATHGQMAIWAEGPYECRYVKREGLWMIAMLNWFPTYYTPFDEGWRQTGLPSSARDDSFPPDAPSTFDYKTFPDEVFVPPYHYRHPVTGAEIAKGETT